MKIKFDGNSYRMDHKEYSLKSHLATVVSSVADDCTHIHTVSSGRNVPLYEMSDAHLLSTISYHAENIADGIGMYSNIGNAQTMLSAVMMGKRGVEDQVEELKLYISAGYAILGRYLVEAVRRNGTVMRGAVEECMPYTNAINNLNAIDPKGMPLLTGESNES